MANSADPEGLKQLFEANPLDPVQAYLNKRGLPPHFNVDGPHPVRRMLQGEVPYQKLTVDEQALANKLAATWKRMGIPFKPKTLGEYLHGLAVFGELLVQDADTDVLMGWIEATLRDYNFSNDETLKQFAPHWRDDSYARVSVGHKLASALMLTSVPDGVEIKAPWHAWVLEVPDGLYPCHLPKTRDDYFKNPDGSGYTSDFSFKLGEGEGMAGQVRAVICKDTELVKMVIQLDNGLFLPLDMRAAPDELSNYIKGVCIAFHDRKHVREQAWARPSTGSKRKGGAPGLGRQYVLSKPVTVDFRGVVREILSGKKGAPTVQWLVRGHWRNQACGKGMQDHKLIWIEPYWKGPEEARVLFRGYSVGQ